MKIGPRLPLQDRLDPYYARLWSDDLKIAWSTAERLHAQTGAGIGHTPTWLSKPSDKAIKDLLGPSQRSLAVAVAGVVHQWRTLTIEQVAAFLGVKALTSVRHAVWRNLFCAGIIDLGRAMADSAVVSAATDSPWLTRPGPVKAWDKLRCHLTLAEVVSVEGGQGWTSHRRADRHNIMATELALRAGEHCPLLAVLGEVFGGHNLVSRTSFGLEPTSSGAAGDLVFVRRDGVRVVVEVTAAAGSTFDAKVDRWGRVLDSSAWDKTGLMVLFFDVSSPEQRARGRGPMVDMRGRLAAMARRWIGVSDRVAIASWQDWFDQPHHVTPGLSRMSAYRPTGPLLDPWQPADLLDTAVLRTPLRPLIDLTAVGQNAACLSGSPHWLRYGKGPNWPQWALQTAGLHPKPEPESGLKP